VTGATGRTGRAVLEHLLHEGRAVRAIGRAARTLAPLHAAGAEPFVADPTEGTGPVVGLHYLEEHIDTLDAAVTHPRAEYFMENLLGQLGNIRRDGVVAAPFDADVAMPYVTAADIGPVAARDPDRAHAGYPRAPGDPRDPG
jgi:hypothetical protein